MNEKLDKALRYAILIYGAIYIYFYLFGKFSEGNQWILLVVLVLTRTILFGKIYRKQIS